MNYIDTEALTKRAEQRKLSDIVAELTSPDPILRHDLTLFAAAALQGLLARDSHPESGDWSTFTEYAERAWKFAQAMVETRP